MCYATNKARKYQLTFNNPVQHGFTHAVIKTTLASFPGIQYWCMCDEIGEQGTPHTHLYLYSPNAILFSTLQQRFMGAHMEAAKGSHRENRDYIRKEGRWLDDAKHETNLPQTFEESGPCLLSGTNGNLSALRFWSLSSPVHPMPRFCCNTPPP